MPALHVVAQNLCMPAAGWDFAMYMATATGTGTLGSSTSVVTCNLESWQRLHT